MFDSFTTISDLYIRTEKGSKFHVKEVDVEFFAYGAVKSKCTVTILSDKGRKTEDVKLVDRDTEELLEAFSIGCTVDVYCDLSTDDGSDMPHVLYRGVVASASDSINSSAHFYSSEFVVSLSSPEQLIPTNPSVYTYSLAHVNGTLELWDSLSFRMYSRIPHTLGQVPGLEDKISHKNYINVAEVTATILDAARQDTLIEGMPNGILQLVNTEDAPVLVLDSADMAERIAESIMSTVLSLQQSLGDWDVFCRILSQFYLNVVPNTNFDDNQNGLKYINVVKNLVWDKEVAGELHPEDYTTHVSMGSRYIAGNFQSVAVAYPKYTTDKPTKDLNDYAVCLLGYDSSGKPKRYEGAVDSGYNMANIYTHIGSDIAIKNIRRLQLPNWIKFSMPADVDPAEYCKDWASIMAVTEAASSIGASGNLIMRLRLPSILNIVKHLGKVVCAELVSDVQTEGRRKVYGMLYNASIHIKLSNESIDAGGKITLMGVRDEATQQEFSVSPRILSYDRHK